ncbi:putative galacturonosyltransferase 14 [Hordeum vulgare]|nr:putative galacturonosyltransferase 14 [Hordeum vulgare]
MLVNYFVAAASNMFNEMGARDNLHDATVEFVHLLDDNTVDIDQAPIDDYGYNELDDGVHYHSQEEHGVEEVDNGVFDQEQAKSRARSKNYTYLKDQILIKAWEVVSLDACIGTDQIAKRY